eukprot:c23562_g1_i1 orf=657-1667(+)
MLSRYEMENGVDFELPEEVLAVLPTDPYEQLDVARKITGMAIASRVSTLESEAGNLRQKLAEKDNTISGLQERLGELEQTLQETTDRLSHALDEQAKLTLEKNVLMASIKKLNRDVAKLEAFKRMLMQSLREDEDISSQPSAAFKSSLVSNNSSRDSDPFSSSREEKSRSEADASKGGSQQDFTLTPHLTPQLTPTGSPGRAPAGGSARAQSMVSSPRRQSTSGSPKRFSGGEGRISLSSSQPASHRTTAPNSPPQSGSRSVRTARVDGKEFFRQARNRLSYEQFSAFLSNIKDLNAHRQTREEALKKAEDIFGPDKKDLYMAFEGLLIRHLPNQG